jgi:type I restriction enzyme S subunit
MENTIIENKKGFKETKLGWIPEDWDVVKLSKLVHIDKSSLSSKTDSEKIINYVSLSDISEGKIVSNKYKFSESPSRARRITLKGDVLLATVRPNLKNFAIVKSDNLIVSTGFAVLTKNKAENEFIYHYLFSSMSERQFYNLTVGSNYPALNSSDIKTFKIVTPPTLEQKNIANCLSTWDTSITKLNDLIKAKKKLKKALMQQLLSGKKRLPSFHEEWQEKRLDFFFAERSERNNKCFQLLSIGEAGVYTQDNSNKKDTSNNDKSKYKKICVGDIGYNTMRMWQGRSALSSLEGIVSPAYTIVKPKKNTDSQFFAYLFKDPAVIHRFFRNSQGMVSDTLNCKFKDFAIIKLELPTNKEEQTAIAKVLKTADQEINLLISKRDQLKLQKNGLMQQLLTGEKRLKI